LKILHVIESMQIGGAERHLANVLGPLAELGAQNEVALLWGGDAYSESVRPFARVHDLGLPPRKVLAGLPRLVQLARGVDLVHTQLPWADIAGRAAAIAARKPSATTLQTTWYDLANVRTFPPAVRRNIDMVRRIDALTARTTRRFFAVSAATKQVYVRELGVPPERIEVLPNTVDFGRFDPAQLGPRETTRRALGLGDGELAVIMVARLVPPKGHADAIAAISRIAGEVPVRLLIAGTGPEEERLRKLAAAEGGPVTFLGPRTDVAELLHASDLFLFPSVIEGMPLALIEAMAMARCCLCSDIPENREAGGDAILYTPAGDVPALTTALRAILGDEPRRRTLGEAARLRSQRYSARTIGARLYRALEDIVGGRGGANHVVAA
jgi:glycosyltransferase involved in cell wall biosynthesis